MPSVLDYPTLYPCDGLYDLTLRFGSEQESLPQDCRSAQVSGVTAPRRSPSRMTLQTYRGNLFNPKVVPTAIRTALVVGSLIFTINYGDALLKNDMTRSRWFSGFLSFVTPYMVSVYGQTQCQLRGNKKAMSNPLS